MSKSNTYENELLLLIFNGVGIPNIADNAGVGPLTELYVALHTADPGEAGDQTTSEATYTGYQRLAVPRTAAGWVVTDNSVSPANNLVFGDPTAGTETLTHASIGVAAAGVSKALYRGELSPHIAIIPGGQAPELRNTSSIVED